VERKSSLENLVKMGFLNTYKGRKVLVTGHTGFKGGWLSLWLHHIGADVTGYSLDPEHPEGIFVLSDIGKKIKDYRGDIRDLNRLAEVFTNEKPEIVFHLAAQPLVLDSYNNPIETFETNIMGTANVLKAITDSSTVKAAIMITTDKCYENREQIWGYRENDAMGGHDPYSASKGAAELIITEGDSASGSITKSRDVNTQAVFSLKGKPLNSYGMSKKFVYQNEEFNLLQSALNIDEDLENLRYNNIVIATDADVDGMHIRLLLLTFFLQFYPDLVKSGHLYILQTPLFRVRNKKETIYCYDDDERKAAIKKLGPNPEITRFKGLGEISPDEFKHFIGASMRLDPVLLRKGQPIKEMLEFYMGKNTLERQKFIIKNLRPSEIMLESTV
jgi:DNA gyrase/topoisomerase IV subunit B